MELKLRGGFGVREGTLAKAGESVITHRHNFDHTTYLLGPARVELLETSVENPGPDDFTVAKSVDKPRGGYVFVAAGKWHRITALADDLRYHCLFVHRAPDGEISDEFDGWQPAYE